MLKKLLAIAAVAMVGVPALAQFPTNPDGVSYNSLDSLGCLMLKECLDEVDPVNSVKELKESMPDGDYDRHAEELDQLFVALNGSGVQVYLAHEDYFPSRHRGIYDVKSNSFFLNKAFVWDEGHMIEVMRHEGWHAAQDCMAGSIDNTFTAVILQDGTVPQYIIDVVARTYPPKPRPWENEAFYAATQPGLTVEALTACAAEKPMWETYTPTPMTREWLSNQGYMSSIYPYFPQSMAPEVSADTYINDYLNHGFVTSYGQVNNLLRWDVEVAQGRVVVPAESLNYFKHPYNQYFTTW